MRCGISGLFHQNSNTMSDESCDTKHQSILAKLTASSSLSYIIHMYVLVMITQHTHACLRRPHRLFIRAKDNQVHPKCSTQSFAIHHASETWSCSLCSIDLNVVNKQAEILTSTWALKNSHYSAKKEALNANLSILTLATMSIRSRQESF